MQATQWSKSHPKCLTESPEPLATIHFDQWASLREYFLAAFLERVSGLRRFIHLRKCVARSERLELPTF